jgi:hypothetical protein
MSAVDEVASQLSATVDRFGRYGDLDQAREFLDGPPEVVEALWAKMVELWRHRKIDPELRAAIIHIAERVCPELVDRLKHELDQFVPAVVLEAHQDELIEDKPTLGAFPCAGTMSAPSIEVWLIEDPRRLRQVTLEVARFCADDRQVAESVLELAHDLEIDLNLAAGIVGHALLDARHPQAVAK